LLLVRVLSIVSTFSFRSIDIFRLAAFTLLMRPLATLALLSLGVLALGIILVVGEFLLLVTASLLAFALWAAERPVAQLLTEQFVTPAQDDGTDAAAAEPRPEGWSPRASPPRARASTRPRSPRGSRRRHRRCAGSGSPPTIRRRSAP